jgi:hypothetical protein
VTSLVFDTTTLSHFARAGRTGELRMAVADDEPVLLAEVAAELARGVPGYPALGSAAAEGWLKQAELEELPELAAFARYKGELGGGPERNNGEAAVLAWVSVNGGAAIIDEVGRSRDRSLGTLASPRVTVTAHPELQDPRARPCHGRGDRGRPYRHRDAPAGRQRRGPFRLGLRGRDSPVAR